MRKLLLFICLLFPLLFPAQMERTAQATTSTIESSLIQKTIQLISAEGNPQEEILPTELDSPCGDIIAGQSSPAPALQRHSSSRPALSTSNHLVVVRQLLKVLSSYMDTLCQRQSRTYNSLRIPNWQRAADNYVFAFRHIII